MRRSSLSLSLVFSFTLAACESDLATPGGPADTDSQAGAGPSPADDTGTTPALERPAPSLALVAEAGCTDDLMTPGYNDCEGEDLLALDLVSAEDADGDGVWKAGETLRLHLELFSTFETEPGAEPWDGVHYPGVLLQLPDGVAVPEPVGSDDTLGGRVAVNWWYLIAADDSYTFTVDLVADETVVEPTELLFTVASLMCGEDRVEDWNRCPTPSPLRVQVGG